MNNNNTAGEVICGVCGREIDPNDWHPCTPLPKPARISAEEFLDKHLVMPGHKVIAAMQEYAAQEVKRETVVLSHEMDDTQQQVESLKSQLEAKDTKLTRLRTLIKQAFDLQYDHLSSCEFEKQVVTVPPTDTPPLP